MGQNGYGFHRRDWSDADGRQALYAGQLFVFFSGSSHPMIEEAFSGLDP
jgi:hypothetical protein